MALTDTIRTTLRLPVELHDEVSRYAEHCDSSLNKHLVRLIAIGLREDVTARLMSLHHDEWLKELKAARKESDERHDRLWEEIKRMWAVKSSLGIKKGAA